MRDRAQGHRPIKEWIVIEPRDAFRSDGVIALPDAYDDDAHGSDGDMIRERNELCLGVVRAVGPGYKHPPHEPEATYSEHVDHDVRVGMKVMYHRASAIKLEGTDPVLVTVRAHGVFAEVQGDVRAVVGGLLSGSG